MIREEMTITNIHDFLWTLFTSDLLPNKYFDDLPATNDFQSAMVIDLSNSISDMNAYGQGSFLIFLYAKPLESGMRNGLLGKMEKEVLRLIDENSDPTYSMSKRYSYSDYDAARNLHMTILEVNILI
jgi:hypothetical protein